MTSSSDSTSSPPDLGSTPEAFHLPVLSPRRKSIQSALAMLVLFGLTVAGIFVGQHSFGRVQDALERDRAAEAEAPVPALQSAAEALETGRQFVLVLGLLTACGGTRVSAEVGQFSRWGRGARLTRRVREEYRVYFDRNATMSGARRRGSGGMDRRSNAAWVSPPAAKPRRTSVRDVPDGP